MKALILAGEESGVLYARRIAAEIRRTDPQAEIRGYGDYGFETGDLAVFGIWAVIRKIFYFLRVKRTMERAILDWRPDVVCTVDYPGMNLKLAAFAKAHGVWSVHVVCPQVWAWHQGRIPKINATLNRICCFFPFEPKLFRDGLATFVGHPLADDFPVGGATRRQVPGERLLAVLPGSRLSEIHYHLPTLMSAAERLAERLAASGVRLRIAIPAANRKARMAIEREVSGSRITADGLVAISDGGARELLKMADAAVVSSGTATLEAALARCPTVLVYKVSYLLGEFLRRAIRGVRHVGLANVIWEKTVGGQAGEYPMPELLQENFTVGNVIDRLSPWLESESARQSAVARLDASMALLKSDGNAISKIVAACREGGASSR